MDTVPAGDAVHPTRTIVIWCPDWPITAASREAGFDPDRPAALIEHGVVFACSSAARTAGVKRGLSLREAQVRCPGLAALPYDRRLDVRAFEPVLARIDDAAPGVAPIRPGTCALRARGPARYYGGEEVASEALRRHLLDFGVADVRVGVADGPFAAEQAARRTGGPPAAAIRIIPRGRSRDFLAPLPIGLVADDPFATLLRRLGVHTLGHLAALSASDVVRRFGAPGGLAHARANGSEPDRLPTRSPNRPREAVAEFEPPLDRIDRIAFMLREPADSFLSALAADGLVCTTVQVEVRTENGGIRTRDWQHPRWFTAADVVDRIRWQLQSDGGLDAGLDSAVCRVRLRAERVDSTAHHEPGLWGEGADERIHHALSRVQGLLGHQGVLTARIGGGRLLAERQRHHPWGDAPVEATRGSTAAPWPGTVPPPLPATVFRDPRPVHLTAEDGDPAVLDDRGVLTVLPERFSPTGRRDDWRRIVGWAGPWPVQGRWWAARSERRVDRFQVVDDTGDAWLLMLADGRWWAEAHYD